MINIGIIGAGHMGSAMIAGWLQSETIKVHVMCRQPLTLPVKYYSETEYQDFIDAVDIIFIAVKPKDWTNLAQHLHTEKLKVSLMAGVLLADLTLSDNNWARIMPNLPVSKGLGCIAIYHNLVSHDELLEQALKPLGNCIMLSEEQQINSFTALAGSGPAWIWHYASIWQNTAVKLGFDKTTAREIVLSTIAGALAISSDKEFIDLCQQVASKGGTTEAGLAQLAQGQNLEQAILAARDKANELGQA